MEYSIRVYLEDGSLVHDSVVNISALSRDEITADLTIAYEDLYKQRVKNVCITPIEEYDDGIER